jgi:oligoribonuclease (3'-5' exoribonuclease)
MVTNSDYYNQLLIPLRRSRPCILKKLLRTPNHQHVIAITESIVELLFSGSEIYFFPRLLNLSGIQQLAIAYNEVIEAALEIAAVEYRQSSLA